MSEIRREGRRSKALAMLATGHRVKDVAAACGVTRATIRRWGLDDDFQKELRRVRKAAAADLAGAARDLVGAALDAARKIVEDPEHPGHVAMVQSALKLLAPQGAGTTVHVDARQAPAPDLSRLSFADLQALRAIRLRMLGAVHVDAEAAGAEAVEATQEQLR
ncbi:MAG: helix-turn-helix domain-containing protein [Deltaproteobacteria bacterium]|nr:helix-turn-helix domain-containing protein [Deltaproteobacteria bacterium]